MHLYYIWIPLFAASWMLIFYKPIVRLVNKIHKPRVATDLEVTQVFDRPLMSEADRRYMHGLWARRRAAEEQRIAEQATVVTVLPAVPPVSETTVEMVYTPTKLELEVAKLAAQNIVTADQLNANLARMKLNMELWWEEEDHKWDELNRRFVLQMKALRDRRTILEIEG